MKRRLIRRYNYLEYINTFKYAKFFIERREITGIFMAELSRDIF